MSTLSTLNTTKYSEYTDRLSNKRRRLSELSENDLVKILTQCVQLFYGEIYGDAAVSAAAKTELEVLYDATITIPTSQIGASVTESSTRRGTGVSLTAGDNTITFSSALPAATYSLTFITYTASGGQVMWTHDPADRTVNGFSINVVSNCKLDYIALYN